MRVVCSNIGELFKLQTDESRIEELEGLSHAFGLLLQTSGIRMMVTASEAVALIRQKVWIIILHDSASTNIVVRATGCELSLNPITMTNKL